MCVCGLPFIWVAGERWLSLSLSRNKTSEVAAAEEAVVNIVAADEDGV
jgi:hypothetical protein